MGDTPFSDVPFSDAELTELALAADPDPVVDPDAPPFTAGDTDNGLLPEWYMPAPRRSAGAVPSRRRVWAVGGIVAALLLVNGAGLCVTYGFPEIAW